MTDDRRPPLSLYIHLPWCVSKCPYCDFNSHSAATGGEQTARNAAYVEALLADLDAEARRERGARPLQSVFIGGGTPSLFAPELIGRVLAGVRDRFERVDDLEITMEANPGTLERGSFAGYRDAGVNRLSIGAQSFDAGSLSRLGRIHAPDDTERAVLAAGRAGFRRINLDLMYGLPGQSVAMALADIRSALSLGVDHVSHYQLTLEPNTRFHANPPALPDEDEIAEMMTAGGAAFAEAGLTRYEISALSAPAARCRHNLNYWRFGDYLAVGAGAHGKWTGPDGVIIRYAKPANPRQYQEAMRADAPPLAGVAVAPDDAIFEFMLNALRLTEGFTTTLFEARTRQPIGRIGAVLARAVARGLLVHDGRGHWRPTRLGFRFLNDLQAEFLPPAQMAVGAGARDDGRNVMHTGVADA